MKAMIFEQFGDPDVMTLRDTPAPVCGPGQVLIDIEAASITPGDWKLRAGMLQKVFPVTLPCIPGRDGAGLVVQVGEGVDYAKVGDAVCFVADRLSQGSYAEQIVRDAESVVPLLPGMSFAQGAAMVHAGMCAWIMVVEYAHVQPGQKVLVHAGSGTVGGMAVQLARHLGAHVAATCSARNADYVRELGAHEIIAYDEQDFSTLLRDYDVVLDLVGGQVHHQSRRVLKPGGALIWLIAQPIPPAEPDGRDIRVMQALIEDSMPVLRGVAELVAQGALRPQVNRIMPLAQAAQGHALVQANQHGRGRIVLDVRGRADQPARSA